MSSTENDIDYIATVRNVKRFFKEFQQLRVVSGLSAKIRLRNDGYLEGPNFKSFHLNSQIKHDKQVIIGAQGLVNRFTEVLNGIDDLQRLILIRYFIDGKQDVAIALETNYGIAQYKRIKRKSVIELATRIEVVVRKQFEEVS
ncbi:hypothetical protein ARW55_13700 [Listeria monocytogenes]|nr:hypothetical protein [Listeria monocytogenes]